MEAANFVSCGEHLLDLLFCREVEAIETSESYKRRVKTMYPSYRCGSVEMGEAVSSQNQVLRKNELGTR